MGLRTYRSKRDFTTSPEPAGKRGPRRREAGGRFVIHKHDATRLHYDLRLELEGVLVSWAVPKGPSLDPRDRRLAVHVEDHPLEYATFEGVIPKGEYGGGPVIVWDRGRWRPDGDPREGYRKGHLSFILEGEKLQGAWNLVQGRPKETDTKAPWFLIKRRDAHAREGKAAAVTERMPRSVASGRTIEEVRAGAGRPPRPAGRRPSDLPGARRAAIPSPLVPQLATLAAEPPEGPEWLHEIKFDGYRILARIEASRARLFSRSGQDWTARFPGIAREAAGLAVRSAVLDGEVVSLKPDGITSFQDLQKALRSPAAADALRYYAFDLLHLDGWDLRSVPLWARKEALARVLKPSRRIAFVGHVLGEGPAFREEACRRGLEGIVSKRADGSYVSRRTQAWRKVRCGRRQEFVVAGYLDHTADPQAIGSLVLAVNERGRLTYAGRVGTGFTATDRRRLRRKLGALSRKTSPFAQAVPVRGRVHWIEPTLVAEVKFTEWTAEGRVRHPSFAGLREDKPAGKVRRERAVAGRRAK